MAARARERASLGTKLVLVAGFGGVLALMAAAGIDSVRALHLIETENTEITRQYLSRHHSLERIRSSLYLSNTYVRDYLVESTPEGARAARVRLEALRAETASALRSYSSSSGPAEAGLVADLDREVQQYWDRLAPIFEWSPAQRRREAYHFLEAQVFPRRALLLAIADKVDAVNERALRNGNVRSAEVFRHSRRRVIGMLALTLGVGLLLAAGSIAYILRLERESKLRFAELQRTEHELKRLSARLVAAQEEERRTISRELHDEVGQSLNALLVDLGNLAAVTPPERREAHELLRTAKSLANKSVTALRNMALLLRPSMLDDFGLVPALHWQAREVSRRTGIRVDVDADENATDLPEEYRTCVYRVVQEALHNSARHAEPRTVRISVRRLEGRVSLAITDDGKGFDAAHVRGLGLIGMEERVKHLNGAFKVQSRPGEGTSVRIELPAPQPLARITAIGA